MKRLAAVLLAFCLIFAGCSSDKPEADDQSSSGQVDEEVSGANSAEQSSQESSSHSAGPGGEVSSSPEEQTSQVSQAGQEPAEMSGGQSESLSQPVDAEPSENEAVFVKAEVSQRGDGAYVLDSQGNMYFYDSSRGTLEPYCEGVVRDFSCQSDAYFNYVLKDNGEIEPFFTQDLGQEKPQPPIAEEAENISGSVVVLLDDGSVLRYDKFDSEQKDWEDLGITAKKIKANTLGLVYLKDDGSLWYCNFSESDEKFDFEEKVKIADNVKDFDYSGYTKTHDPVVLYITEDNHIHIFETLITPRCALDIDYVEKILGSVEAMSVSCIRSYYLIQLMDGTYMYGYMSSDIDGEDEYNQQVIDIKGVYGDVVDYYYAIIDEDGNLNYGTVAYPGNEYDQRPAHEEIENVVIAHP